MQRSAVGAPLHFILEPERENAHTTAGRTPALQHSRGRLYHTIGSHALQLPTQDFYFFGKIALQIDVPAIFGYLPAGCHRLMVLRAGIVE